MTEGLTFTSLETESQSFGGIGPRRQVGATHIQAERREHGVREKLDTPKCYLPGIPSFCSHFRAMMQNAGENSLRTEEEIPFEARKWISFFRPEAAE